MSESSSKSSQPLASKQEKDGAEKRGRGRPRKQPPVSPGTALVGSQVGVQTFASVYLFGLGRCPASWQVKTGLAGCGIIPIYMCSPHTASLVPETPGEKCGPRERRTWVRTFKPGVSL